MTQPVIYIAITSHGFGHAVRAATVANKLQQLRPDISLIVASVSPQWLLKSYIEGDFTYHSRVFDVGVIQSDSLTMDRQATLEKMQRIIAQEEEIIAEETAYLREQNVGLVLADIPALAVPIAHKADVPCWMMSNFGWDFIYRDWGAEFAEVTAWIENYYRQCDRLFRLPFAEPMTVFSEVVDVGLTGAKPRYEENYLRDKFELDTEKENTIMLTFGGMGLQALPYQNLKDFPNKQFITFDRNAPDLPNLLIIKDNNYRPVDFLPLCDRVVSKPGYSTFCEAVSLDVPVVSLTREGFAEAPVMLEVLQNYSYHQIVPVEEFFEGNWDFLRQDLVAPRKSKPLAKDGADVIVREIANYFPENR